MFVYTVDRFNVSYSLMGTLLSLCISFLFSLSSYPSSFLLLYPSQFLYYLIKIQQSIYKKTNMYLFIAKYYCILFCLHNKYDCIVQLNCAWLFLTLISTKRKKSIRKITSIKEKKQATFSFFFYSWKPQKQSKMSHLRLWTIIFSL
jgi:hypothetical protein